MDLNHIHGTKIHVLRACQYDDASDLIALGGEHSVEVLLVTEVACRCIASFHVGTRISALAWSSSTVSPSRTDDWNIEITAAASDFGLHLLTKSASAAEYIFPFGGGLSGHHGKVNDMSFCGGWGQDSSRYVATVSDDKMLMVWDLHPTLDIVSNKASPHIDGLSPSPVRAQPTAYVIPFPHPLTTISSHPLTSKEFLVSDCHGSLFITDWRSDPDDGNRTNLRHTSLVELVEPYSLAASATGLSQHWSGSVAWRTDTPDIIGSAYGTRFSIWDMSSLRGGKPMVDVNSFPEGCDRFRWARNYPEYFAVSTKSPNKGAVIHVHNLNFPQAQPHVFHLQPRPQFVQDFDFMASPGIPRIAAAVGRTAVIFSIGMEA